MATFIFLRLDFETLSEQFQSEIRTGLMAEKSIFREFIATLRKRWKNEHPSICPLTEACGRLPKASTFYAGVSRFSRQHVYLYFQHSSKAWNVGRFTINVVLSLDEQNPEMGLPDEPASHFGDGSHRIGHLIGTQDKWWHLKENGDPIISEAWRPSSYEKVDIILSEAVEDVTKDVLSALRLLDVPVE